MPKPVFFDPGKKRWKRLRIVLNIAGVLTTALMIAFFLSMTKPAVLASLGLPGASVGDGLEASGGLADDGGASCEGVCGEGGVESAGGWVLAGGWS